MYGQSKERPIAHCPLKYKSQSTNPDEQSVNRHTKSVERLIQKQMVLFWVSDSEVYVGLFIQEEPKAILLIFRDVLSLPIVRCSGVFGERERKGKWHKM